jgi:hypothetical protein
MIWDVQNRDWTATDAKLLWSLLARPILLLTNNDGMFNGVG